MWPESPFDQEIIIIIIIILGKFADEFSERQIRRRAASVYRRNSRSRTPQGRGGQEQSKSQVAKDHNADLRSHILSAETSTWTFSPEKWRKVEEVIPPFTFSSSSISPLTEKPGSKRRVGGTGIGLKQKKKPQSENNNVFATRKQPNAMLRSSWQRILPQQTLMQPIPAKDIHRQT